MLLLFLCFAVVRATTIGLVPHAICTQFTPCSVNVPDKVSAALYHFDPDGTLTQILPLVQAGERVLNRTIFSPLILHDGVQYTFAFRADGAISDYCFVNFNLVPRQYPCNVYVPVGIRMQSNYPLESYFLQALDEKRITPFAYQVFIAELDEQYTIYEDPHLDYHVLLNPYSIRLLRP